MVGERQTRRQKDIGRLKRERMERIQPARGRLIKQDTVVQKAKGVFNRREIKELKLHGLNKEEAFRQYALLQAGTSFVKLHRPARLGDGILVIEEKDYARLVSLHEEAMACGRMLKFVPASGAATRMFQDWYDLLGKSRQGLITPSVLDHLERYPFYPEIREASLRRGINLDDREVRVKRLTEILETILGPGGLNYGDMPKALIPFHRYSTGVRTALEEHLLEAAHYVCDSNHVARLHFTVQADHEGRFREFLSSVITNYEKTCGVTFEITISSQSSDTDAIALNERGEVLKDENGRIVFRPGGHGALLKNLQALGGDIVFVKNIDNVVREEHLSPVVFWHKLMGGFLLETEKKVHHLLKEVKEGRLDEAHAFVEEVLDLKISEKIAPVSSEEKKEILYDLLHRPIRVAGMVKNEGEPGGGPFWVEMPEGDIALQIVEEVQVNTRSAEQQKKWQEATHFNPVDMVLSLRDEEGKNYDLSYFADPRMAIVTRKTFRGKPIRVLEHPGLWNGGMARWLTFFVEIPSFTFNPVKTCADLLRPAHQPSEK
ncbi:MAG: DUF4301 family protein [Syntrophales bacterium]|nr:DUF4301 family protein [Syntrophales bacterium]